MVRPLVKLADIPWDVKPVQADCCQGVVTLALSACDTMVLSCPGEICVAIRGCCLGLSVEEMIYIGENGGGGVNTC